MNLRLIFSRALFLVWVSNDFRRVNIRFFGPMQQPLGRDVSKLTYESKLIKGSIKREQRDHLDHDEVLLDLAVVREASHGVDGLVGDIVFRGSVVLYQLG